MKKQNLDGRKLALSRETLLPLSSESLDIVAGGAAPAAAAGGSTSWIPLACFSCQPQGGECKISVAVRC